eukprot:scaffold14541_cov137-Skeletonema_menzelii.AAC.10
MQFRKSTAFIASSALLFISSKNVTATATSLRGFNEDVEADEILTEEKPGTFLRVSDNTDRHRIVAGCYCRPGLQPTLSLPLPPRPLYPPLFNYIISSSHNQSSPSFISYFLN